MTQNNTFFPTFIDIKYSNNAPILRLFGRDSNDNPIIKNISNCDPYFYILESEREKIPNNGMVKRIENGAPTIHGEKILKLIVPNPNDIYGKKEDAEYLNNYFDTSYEADLKFVDRMRIDLKLNNYITTPKNSIIIPSQIEYPEINEKINLRTHISDFENNDSFTIDEAKEGKSEIYSFVIWDSYTDIYHVFTHLKMNDMMKMIVSKKLREYWSDHKKYSYMKNASIEFHISDSEPLMFIDYIGWNKENKPDIIAGWNYIDYDNNLLFERMKVLENEGKLLKNTYLRLSEVNEVRKTYWHFGVKRGTTYNVAGTNIIDIEHLYEKLQSSTLKWTSLNYAAEKELNTKKLERVSTKEMSQVDIPHLIAYNIVDVMLTKLIEEKKQLINIFVELDSKGFSKLGELSYSVLIDRILLNHVKNRFVLPSKTSLKKIDRSNFIGGIVLEPTVGLHKNVVVLDYRGLYSTIMRSLNISIENKHPDGDIIAKNGIRFNSSPKGIIPQILEDLTNERDIFKSLRDNSTTDDEYSMYDAKQESRKILGNSFYGNMGYDGFRMIDIDTAIAITSTGQYLNLSGKSLVESLGYKVIYGDTDSIFILFDENYTYTEMKEEALQLCHKINKKLTEIALTEFNVKDHVFEIEFDKSYETLFQVYTKKGKAAKKRYAGLQYNDDGTTKFTAKGFEFLKASTAEVTKVVQKELIELILIRPETSELKTYLIKVKEKFFNGDFPESFYSIRYNVNNRMIDSKDSIVKRACNNSNQLLNRHYKKGDSVLVYFTEYPNELALDYNESIPSQFKIDYEISWLKYIINPLESILKSYNIDWDYIKTGLRENNLNNFIPQQQNTQNVEQQQQKPIIKKQITKSLSEFF